MPGHGPHKARVLAGRKKRSYSNCYQSTNSKNQHTYVSSLALHRPLPGAEYPEDNYWKDKINYVHCLVPDPYWQKWADEAGDDPAEGEYRGRCVLEGPPHTPTPAFYEMKVFFESLDMSLLNGHGFAEKILAEDNQVMTAEAVQRLTDFGKQMAEFGMNSMWGMFESIRKAPQKPEDS